MAEIYRRYGDLVGVADIASPCSLEQKPKTAETARASEAGLSKILTTDDRGRACWHGMIAAMARHGHDPIAKFIRWLEDARRARIPNYEAMALATAARSGKTSVRFVLLKGIDQRGFMRLAQG